MSMSQSEIRLLEMRLSKAERELNSEKELHEIAKGFHDVAVKERDYERLKNDRLRRDLAEAHEKIALLRADVHKAAVLGYQQARDDAAMAEPKEVP
jgi:hypothetical protein